MKPTWTVTLTVKHTLQTMVNRLRLVCMVQSETDKLLSRSLTPSRIVKGPVFHQKVQSISVLLHDYTCRLVHVIAGAARVVFIVELSGKVRAVFKICDLSAVQTVFGSVLAVCVLDFE